MNQGMEAPSRSLKSFHRHNLRLGAHNTQVLLTSPSQSNNLTYALCQCCEQSSFRLVVNSKEKETAINWIDCVQLLTVQKIDVANQLQKLALYLQIELLDIRQVSIVRICPRPQNIPTNIQDVSNPDNGMTLHSVYSLLFMRSTIFTDTNRPRLTISIMKCKSGSKL